MIPGRLLHQFARWCCSDEFRSRVVEAQLADWRHEWAMTGGAVAKGIVLGRGYGAFWRALGSGALHGLRGEIRDLTWRDAFPFPGVLATTIVLIKLAETWVRTGAIWSARFDAIDTRWMWPMVPMALVQRRWPTLSGVRGIAVYVSVFYVSAIPLSYTGVFREQMRGWIPFVVLLAVLTLAQPRKSRALPG